MRRTWSALGRGVGSAMKIKVECNAPGAAGKGKDAGIFGRNETRRLKVGLME